jgi:hypothetical protein
LFTVEVGVLVPLVAVLVWTAVAPGTAAIATTFVLAVLGAAVLVLVAWTIVPEDHRGRRPGS